MVVRMATTTYFRTMVCITNMKEKITNPLWRLCSHLTANRPVKGPDPCRRRQKIAVLPIGLR